MPIAPRGHGHGFGEEGRLGKVALSLVVGSSACSMTTFRVPACLAKGKRELETLYKRLIGHSSIIGALVICGHSGAALKQVATMCLL